LSLIVTEKLVGMKYKKWSHVSLEEVPFCNGFLDDLCKNNL